VALDGQLYLAVQQLTGTPVLDSIMVVSAELLVLLIPVSLVATWLVQPDDRKDALYTFAVAVTGTAVAYGLGLFYSHPSPLVAQEIIAPTGENAFPSQHTAVIFATAFGYVWRKKPAFGGTMLGAAAVTGFARVYISEHWPVDIFGGIIAAGLGLGIVYLLEDRLDGLMDHVVGIWETLEDRTITIGLPTGPDED
jgi:undecaprenyl-diphosphatase